MIFLKNVMDILYVAASFGAAFFWLMSALVKSSPPKGPKVIMIVGGIDVPTMLETLKLQAKWNSWAASMSVAVFLLQTARKFV